MEREPQPTNLVEAYDYRGNFLSVYDEIERVLEQNENDLKIGPTYIIPTSRNLQLNILTTYVDNLYEYEMTPENEKAQRFILLALDKDNRLLGHLVNTITRRHNYIASLTNIMTRFRGLSLAMPLEAAHHDILQRIATLENSKVIERAINNNLSDLLELQQIAFRQGLDEILHKRIEDKAIEQERWVSLYGPGGRAGYDAQGYKTLIPVGDSHYKVQLDMINQINLDRADHVPYPLKSQSNFLSIERQAVDRESKLNILRGLANLAS